MIANEVGDMDRYRLLLLVLAGCLVLGSCGDFEEDDGQILQGLAPNGLGNGPEIEMSGLGTSPFAKAGGSGTETSGLGDEAGHESGLGAEAAGSGSGLQSGGSVDLTSVCQNVISMGCFDDEDIEEEITVEDCVGLVEYVAGGFEPQGEWLACLAGANSCHALEICSEKYSVDEEEDHDNPPPAILVDCQQICEDQLARFEVPPEVIEECVNNCEEGF